MMLITLGEIVSVEFEKLYTWFNLNRLPLNIGITDNMLFSNNLNKY